MIGVLGYDTNETTYLGTEERESISELLQKFFIEKTLNIDNREMRTTPIFDFRDEFCKHMDFVNQSFQTKLFMTDFEKNLERREKLVAWAIGIFGFKVVRYIFSLTQSFRERLSSSNRL